MSDQITSHPNYGVEQHSIDYIPTTERHGKVRDQGPFWFTGNFQFLLISIGFIGPGMGLSFLWTSVAGILGIMFGTLFMAFHATQGPVPGLPQMVQSRAQFGYRGVIVPLFGTLVNYGGMLTLVTAADSIKPVKPTKAIRAVYICVITALWALVAWFGGQSAMNALTLVLTIILYLLVPWTSVNLVDFFFVRRGHYAVTQLFKPHGIYGEWAWRGLLSYALGWVAIIPFAVLPGLWTGPLAAKLGGVDIGWLMGLLAAGGSYYVIGKGIAIDTEYGAIQTSETELKGYALAAGE